MPSNICARATTYNANSNTEAQLRNFRNIVKEMCQVWAAFYSADIFVKLHNV